MKVDRKKVPAGSKSPSGDLGLKRSKFPCDPEYQGEANEDLAVKRSMSFPVVALGASAGGLEAFTRFFKALPPDTGMAFIVVAHLDPTHVSLLPDLLQKQTVMKVVQAKNKQKIQPNSVYVIPPNKDLSILNRVLFLLPPPRARGMNLPINRFFCSLAQDQGERASAIVLSGTGTDGTLGVKAIKAAGGVVLVQDEASALYTGMPKSEADSGYVDYTLPSEKMPDKLISYFSTERSSIVPAGSVENTRFADELPKILVILRNHTGHDFSLYKRNTLLRRVERRLHVHQIDSISSYIQFLQKSETEAAILFKDLLIGVTSFFRDPEAFDILKQQVIPKLLSERADDQVIRIWVPGCSTGEEVYSIAMVFDEVMESMNRQVSLQLFGTDIDDGAIEFARVGLYPPGIRNDVNPERLKRFFIQEKSGFFYIKKGIRERIIFALQNVIKDPPFTKLDMLSCRNLLIYLTAELQKKLLPIFGYSLKPNGILFLGSSETIGMATDLFAPLDRKWKIYRQLPESINKKLIVQFPTQMPMDQKKTTVKKTMLPVPEEINELSILESILHQSEIPSGVVTDETGQIYYIHGSTGKFLEPSIGLPRLNLFNMAREGLKKEIASVLRKARSNQGEVVKRGVRFKSNGDEMMVTLTLRPLVIPKFRVRLFLLLFDLRGATGQPKSTPAKTDKKGETTEWLEEELTRTRHTLYTTIEELETSNEELKSTNEELQSTNEEMQSANEELETSREELQSMNEESATVNAELQARIDELSKANDDMKNLLDSTDIAIIFLDKNLNIRRFTPRVTDMMSLTSSDIGRPVRHFASTLKNVDMESLSAEVLHDLAMKDVKAASTSGQLYQLRIRPYRTMNNVIDGVVITLENITQQKPVKKQT